MLNKILHIEFNNDVKNKILHIECSTPLVLKQNYISLNNKNTKID